MPRTLPRGTTLALLIAVTLSLSACGGAASSDLTDLVEPLVTPSEDLLEPLGDPGVGTITMTQESHGSYTRSVYAIGSLHDHHQSERSRRSHG